MIKKKLLVAAVFICSLNELAGAQETTVIKGNVNGDLQGYKKVYLYGKGHATDSTEIVDGHFQFTIPYEKSFIPLLYDEYSFKKLGGIRIFPILVDRPGTVEIKDINIKEGVSSGKITGIKSAEDFQDFSTQQNTLMNDVNIELQKKHGSIPAFPADGKITPEFDAYMKEQQTLINKKLPALMESFIKSHPDSYATIFILSGTGVGSFDTADLKRLFDMLPKNMQQSDEGKEITNYLEGIKKSETGKPVADFTLNNAQGKPVNFKDLKGKYILIDFWASWCGPCKQSFPHMKEIYSKFKGDKFEIYSISIDKNKPDWIKELKAQQLPWIQGIDDKSIAHKYFGVTAVPTTFLISPDGKIIMKEIGFSQNGDMEKKLVELLASK
ncbi:TlpA disulfide reductase family protein [Mucilaginibacter pineti]|nr:TlpA disulfide reductase family protein [Mucilaginibacter pineti]